MPFIFAFAVCVCTVVALGTVSYLQGKPFELANDNGETFISAGSKADIIGNIYEQQDKLVILEIVPYENAGIMDMLVGTDKVKTALEANKEALYKKFKSTEVDCGNYSIVTVGGSIASYHPFDIVYNETTQEYTLKYNSTFLNTLVDSINDPRLYNYFSDNIEVRTVVAGELTEEDLENVSLIYIAGYAEDAEVVNFNRYINGEISTEGLDSISGIEGIGAYTKEGGKYNEIATNDIASAWYNAYVKNDDGEFIKNDMSWDMVEKVIDYVYSGNAYTDGQPVPCIVNYDDSIDKSANVYKLSNLILKTSNEEDAEYKGVSTYYKNVMACIEDGVYTYDGKEYPVWNSKKVPLFEIKSALSNDYVFNFAYKTQNSVNDLLFLMGSPTNLYETIADNGSGSVRNIGVSGEEQYTTSDVIRYLLNGGGDVDSAYDSASKATGDEAPEDDEIIRVLEIEPCMDFMYDYYGYNVNSTENVIESISQLGQALGITSYSKITTAQQFEDLDNNAKRIEFECVTPQEFNGMNKDLIASYDLVIIGTRTGQLNTMNDVTVYNDDELLGYIYLAYGDLVKCQQELLGFLRDDYRGFSSSQITNSNGFRIDYYANASTTSWDSQKTLYNINNTKVWSPLLQNSLSSSKYWVLKSYTSWSNVWAYFEDDFGNTRTISNDLTDKKKSELIEFINVDRPVVLADDLYSCESTKAAYPTSNIYDLVSSNKSKSNIISMSDMQDKLTDVMLDTVLEITSYKMTYDKDGVTYDAPQISYSGNLIADSCIVHNVEQFDYTVTFNAETGKKYFVKAIVDKDTDGRFDSEPTIDDFNEVYYAKIVTATSNTVTVDLNIELPAGYNGMFGWKILIEELNSSKVVVDAVSVQGYTVVTGETRYVKALQIAPNNSYINLASTSNTFYNCLTTAVGKINYSVQIDTITADNFEKKFVHNPYTKGESYNTSSDYLKSNGYTMVILGFADSWGGEDISDDYGALSCLMDYMEKGNSVLMSHDVLTFYYCGNYEVGTNNEGSGYKIVNARNGKGSMCVSLKLRDLIGMDVYDITTISDLSASTLAASNVPQKVDGTYVREIQGFTNWHIYRYLYNYNYVSTKGQFGTLYPWKNANYMARNTSTVETIKVEEVNRGQISMYPYNVSSSDGTLEVSPTHPQYFRVDLEDDDLVVWYTLASSGRSYNKFYDDSGKDVANNYYIYSKGNITYTGAGHSTDINKDRNLPEMRLFVNTVIRAATAGNFVPEVKVLNGSITADADTYVVVPGALATNISVIFEAFDEDLATREIVEDSYSTETEIREHIGRFQEGTVYYVSSDGNEYPLYKYSRTGTYLLNGEETTIEIYDPFPGVTGSARDSAKSSASALTRNMANCYDEYVNSGSVNLRIEAKDYAGATGSCNVEIVEHELFKLD